MELITPKCIFTKFKSLGYCLTMCCIAFATQASQKNSNTTENIPALVETLSKNLYGLGSFEARYHLIKQEQVMGEVLFVYNKQQNYLLMTSSSNLIPQFNVSMVYEITDKKEIQFTGISSNEAIRYIFNYQKVLLVPDNPAGLVNTLLTQLEVPGLDYTYKDTSHIKTVSPELELGLTKETVLMALGANVTEKKSPFLVSWLAPETLATATEIQETDQHYIFKFNESHEVHIDKNSGLLVMDTFLNKETNPNRLIKLVEYKKIQSADTVNHYLKGKNTPEIKIVAPVQLNNNVSVFYLKKLAKQFQEEGGLTELKKLKKAKLSEVAYQGGMESARHIYGDYVNQKNVDDLAKNFITVGFDEYLEMPESRDPKSELYELDMTQYLAWLTKKVILDPSVLIIGQEKTLSDAPVLASLRAELNNLPDSSRESMLKFYGLIEKDFRVGYTHSLVLKHFHAASKQVLLDYASSEPKK